MAAGGSSVEVIPVFRSDELENLHNEIGRGGMGVVSLYRWNVDEPNLKIRKGQRAAVKKLEYTSDIRSVKDEARILWPLHGGCPYILRMFGLMDTPDVRIVLDYMEHGNIATFFTTINTGIDVMVELDHLWPLKTRIAQQVCEGMFYLHDRARPILHCDLKAANILLDEKLDVKICDFGLAKIKCLTTRSKSDESKDSAVNNPACTVSHVAPELLSLQGRPTKKSDVYSFGILLWELLTDRRPYEGVRSHFIIITAVRENGRRPDLSLLPVAYPQSLGRMMTEAWHQDPAKRRDFSELRHRFNKADNREVEDSVQFALQTWERACEAETNPKKLFRSCTTRSANDPVSESYQFPTQDVPDVYTRRPPSVPPVSDDRQQATCADPSPEEICISVSSAPSSAIQPTEHVTDPKEPLIGTERSPPRVIQRPAIVNPKKCSCAKIAILVAIMCFLCAAVGTLFVGRYVIPSYTKGCCLNCFDPVDPGLRSSCDIPNDSSIAPTGSTCKFSCKDGYVLNGNVTELKCEDNGVWSGPFPYCRKIRQCPALKLPANGGSMHCTHSYFEGSKCSFSCPDGYILQLPGDQAESSESSDDFDVTCEPDKLMNYQWSGKEPYCKKVVSCDPPTKDPNVKSNCDSGDYINGTVCNFSCAEEMSLWSNESTGLCQDSGKWNLTSDVSCIQGCPYYHDPLHGNSACTLQRKYNSKCTFSCDTNFVMVGYSYMVCQVAGPHKGEWTKSVPRCECPYCRSGDNCENARIFKDAWDQMNASKSLTSWYDGREIICLDKPKVMLKKHPDSLSYGCQCRDNTTNINKQCNDNASKTEACHKAFATLILMMSYSGTCTLPCDAADMPGMCP